ncbi:MAG: hypothetical protein K5656_07055 [Lachnospiraceae bacterium]|nr:hypothetical protein [Lachnospiraceae bacterium]
MGDPKEKKEEQKSVIELMNDTIYELSATLDSLKERLAEELSYTEGEASEASAGAVVLQKEIGMVERQLNYTTDYRDQCELLLSQFDDEKKKKEMEETLKGVLIVGAINEYTRKRIALEIERENELNVFFENEPEEVVVHNLFAKKKYHFVTEDDVETIKQDKELNEMAEFDPYRYLKQALMHKDKYERMMEKYLFQNGIAYEDSFEDKEKKFITNLAKPNKIETSINTVSSIEQTADVTNSFTAEQRKIYDEIKESMRELAKITRRNQNDFIKGESSFKKGNKYTEELINKEKELYKKIVDLRDVLTSKHMEIGKDSKLSEEEKTAKQDLLEPAILILSSIETPVKQQVEMDNLFLESKGIRVREEMWDVYKNIPAFKERVRNATRHISRTQSIAITKGTRIKEKGRRKGGCIGKIADWAKEASDDINEMLANRTKGKRKFTAEEKAEIKNNMAIIILNQIMLYEDDIARKYDAPNLDYLKKVSPKNLKQEFLAMADDLAQMPMFKKLIKNLEGKNFEDKCTKFMASDVERDIAVKFRNIKIEAPEITKQMGKNAMQK